MVLTIGQQAHLDVTSTYNPLPWPTPTKFVVNAQDHADNWFEQSSTRGNTCPREMD